MYEERNIAAPDPNSFFKRSSYREIS